jgi:hypothetical protein
MTACSVFGLSAQVVRMRIFARRGDFPPSLSSFLRIYVAIVVFKRGNQPESQLSR